jgi:hypothetical protein
VPRRADAENFYKIAIRIKIVRNNRDEEYEDESMK